MHQCLIKDKLDIEYIQLVWKYICPFQNESSVSDNKVSSVKFHLRFRCCINHKYWIYNKVWLYGSSWILVSAEVQILKRLFSTFSYKRIPFHFYHAWKFHFILHLVTLRSFAEISSRVWNTFMSFTAKLLYWSIKPACCSLPVIILALDPCSIATQIMKLINFFTKISSFYL